MAMSERWDSRLNNLIAAFDTERETLAIQHDILREQGERAFEYLMLIEDNVGSDETREVAMGLALADLVRRAA